jgi:hypothetical protein
MAAFDTAIDRDMNLSPEDKELVSRALDHVNPFMDYGDMNPAEAAAEFIEDVLYSQEANDDYDADYEEPNEPFDMAEMLDPTAAEEIAKLAGNYEAAVDKLMDMGLTSQEADKIANEFYPEEEEYDEDEAAEAERINMGIDQGLEDRFDEIYSLKESKDEKGKWTNANGKSMYDQFSEINNLNGQEVLIGIDYEREKNPELTKAAAAKIVVKNLKKNPIYYTSALMSGIEGYEPEYIGGKSANPEAHQMQYLDKNMGNVVDKKRGMQPVKGIEKAKKDSDKGGETNKAVKGVELMSLIAKTVRGMKKMDATGEKMKKIAMRESFASWLSDKRGEEMASAAASEVHNGFKIGDNVKVNSEAANSLRIDPNDVYKIQSFRKIKPGSLMQSVDATIVNDQGNTFTVNVNYLYEAGKVANTIFNRNANITAGLKSLTKDELMEIIRKEIAGAYGGDAMSAEDGSSYVNKSELDEGWKEWLLGGLITLSTLAGVGKVYQMEKEAETDRRAQVEYYHNILEKELDKMSDSDKENLGYIINEKTHDLAFGDEQMRTMTDEDWEYTMSRYAEKYVRSHPNQFSVATDGSGVHWNFENQ